MPQPQETAVSFEEQIDLSLKDALNLRVSDISQSIENTKRLLEKSTKSNYKKGQAYAHSYLAFFYMIVTEHVEAQPHIDAALEYFKKTNDKYGLAFTYKTIGSIHYKTDDYHIGLKYLLQAYNLFKEIDDVINQSRTLKSIGTVYQFFNDYEKAEETYRQCIKLSDSINDLNGISNALNPLSGLYLKEGDTENAFETINRSIVLKRQTEDLRGLGFALYGRAKIYDYLEDYENAEVDYLESLKIHEELQEHVGCMMALNKLGQLYKRWGKTEKAKEKLLRCVDKGKNSHHNLILYRAYKALHQIARDENKVEEALMYLEKHNEHKDKVQKRDVKNVIRSLHAISKVEMLEQEAKWQKEKKEEVEKKNKELDNFVYKVSHDLRGPISSLMGLNNVVKLDIKDEKSLKYFGMYHSQIQRLENIILDFIDLTRIKESKIVKSKIDFNQLIDQCINAYNYMPNFDSINFSINVDKSLDFHSDKSSVNSIIQNLIENAIKYTSLKNSPFVEVDVSSTECKEYVKIIVRDNGIGIQEEYKGKIFDMFFRANSEVQGSGLGLYILKTATERLRGEVELESEYEKGTTFTITLPLK
ncbi:MAG: tetratricopeptide repeat-containing sensor histidine kinase [Cyclobacteriaceae bacterium]|nr:tetratricopeptide repeat-containing sensor histidine kinase [Cyclobacteriaceae bacterium]